MPGYELFGDLERREVLEVLETGALMRYGFDGRRNGVWKAHAFEQELVRRFGARYAHAVSSGTAALTTMLAAAGIGSGDEVILPSFTFIATVEAILSVGAVPVIADVNESLTLDPDAVRAAVGPGTKAVMPVHMCGGMADMDALSAICGGHHLLLLEDACQAAGASYHGRYAGTIGHAGAFSFDYVKLLTCGEGGAIVTGDAEIYKRCDQFSDHGHDHVGTDRGAEHHPYLGYNYRISELNAAVGLAQLRRLDEFLQAQRRNHDLLRDAISEIPGIQFRPLPDPDGIAGSFLSFMLPSEEQAREAMSKFRQAGMTGIFYWYDNNWHYVRKWQHLQSGSWMYRVPREQKKQVLHYSNSAFAASDAVVGRYLSVAVSLLWDEPAIDELARKIKNILSPVLRLPALS